MSLEGCRKILRAANSSGVAMTTASNGPCSTPPPRTAYCFFFPAVSVMTIASTDVVRDSVCAVLLSMAAAIALLPSSMQNVEPVTRGQRDTTPASALMLLSWL